VGRGKKKGGQIGKEETNGLCRHSGAIEVKSHGNHAGGLGNCSREGKCSAMSLVCREKD